MKTTAKPGAPAIIAILLGLVALAVLAKGFSSVVRALFVPGAGESVTKQDERITKSAEAYSTGIDEHAAQISGRSLFFIPGAPPPPPPPPAPTVDPGPPPPPSKPTSYGGPSIIAMVNDSVWFSDGSRLKVGEEPEGAKVKVLALEAPWNARVLWEGVEFSVSLFDRDKVVNKPPEPAPSEADRRDETVSEDAKKESEEAKEAPKSDTPPQTTPPGAAPPPKDPASPGQTPPPSDPAAPPSNGTPPPPPPGSGGEPSSAGKPAPGIS